MAKRHTIPVTTEDTTVLADKAQEEIDARYETPGVQGLLQYYDGNKRELVSALAGTDNAKDLAYKNAQRNVNRWLKGTRTPGKDMKAKFDALVANSKGTFATPPSGPVHVTISGTIGYDDNVRTRTLSFSIPAQWFIPIMQQAANGDTHAAYGYLMSAYFGQAMGTPTPITVYGGDDLSITFG